MGTVDAQNINQMTRWVNTKEEHCCKIIPTMSEYCLCQRVKPVGAPGSPFTEEKDFMDALKAHHAVMVNAMKAKQTVDVAQCDALSVPCRTSQRCTQRSKCLRCRKSRD